MAYAAAISLKDTLKSLYNSSDKLTNIHCPPSYIKILYNMAFCVQAFDFDGKGVQGTYLEKEIRDALWRAEDIIESYILSILSPKFINKSPGDMSHASNFSKDILGVMQELESTAQRINKFSEDLNLEIENSIPDATSVIRSTYDLPPVHKNKMVGLDKELKEMKKEIFGENTKCYYPQLGAIVIHGMGGIGKTSLAISIYNDLDVRSHFYLGAWIKISLQHTARNILLNLWHTMEFFHDKEMMKKSINSTVIDDMDDEELANFLREKFTLQKYLVIVDCLCDINLNSWDYIKTVLPDSNNGSRILLISRARLIRTDHESVLHYYRKGFLDASQSWDLLQQQVFKNNPCLDKVLERIGERIAENCQGLPLAIITVGMHLAKNDKTVDYWNKVEKSGNLMAYETDGAPMFEQLGLSYNQMPRYLKPLFLYMGAFPERQEIFTFELRRLLMAENLIDPDEFKTLQDSSSEQFDYFTNRDLVIETFKDNIELSVWSLHHALWHFCRNQARKEKFFYVLDDYISDSEDSKDNRRIRRLVIQKVVFFVIDDLVHKLKKSMISIRSMLFTSPYHPYPLLRIPWGSYRKLRVLNACSIRFYEFPTEILSLELLRYLALTLNGGEIPPGISKLSNESQIYGSLKSAST